MPEGHTIHRQAILQAKLLVGQVVAVSSPQGRFDEAGVVDGRRLMPRLRRYGERLAAPAADDLRV